MTLHPPISESIYSDGNVTVPLARVQHIEHLKDFNEGALWVIMDSTRYDFEKDVWDNPVFIPRENAPRFMRVWCDYRHEMDGPFKE